MNNYWNKYPVIQKDLEKIEDILKENMKCKEKKIEKTLLEMVSSGGKMLRPSFLLLAGRFGKFSSKKLYPLASVIEILHMATLIHDDIIDNSEYRRGVRTIQAEYGPNYAVFTGDLLFTRCFMLLSDNTSMENMKLISNVIARICQGEIEQYSAHYQIDNTVKQYLRRISTKTAALFSLSFFIGASESKCSKNLTKQLARIGYNIGMAFQIIDDILDYVGSEDLVGKPLGNDLKHGIFTLPLIYTLMEKDNEISEVLKKKDYSDEDIQYIINKTIELGGLKRARDLAHRYTQRAFNIIDTLPNCESKRIITEITETLLIREY
jgi:heptaprenyl diphosphate synthase